MEAAEASGRGRRRSLLTCRSVHSPGLLKARLPSSPRPCVPSYENSRPRDDASGSNYLWPRKFADRLSLRNGSESLVPRQLYGDANPPPVKMTVNSALGVTTPCVPLPPREGGKEGGGGGGRRNAKQSRRVRQVWRRAKLSLPRTAMAKDHGGRLFSAGIGSTLRGNLNRVVFSNEPCLYVFPIPFSLSLHIYMFRCEISNELEARILGRI